MDAHKARASFRRCTHLRSHFVDSYLMAVSPGELRSVVLRSVVAMGERIRILLVNLSWSQELAYNTPCSAQKHFRW